MRIVKFQAENVKKLRCVEIKPDGNVVQITGPNGSGKTSVLDSIYYALAGTKEIPSQPIRKGTEKARIKLDLGEITVERRFTASGTTLIVEGAKGARFPSPQKMLDDLVGSLSFDPLNFSRMDPRKQLETLRGMVKIDINIDALDAKSAADYAERTEVNKNAKALQSRIDAIKVPEGTPTELVVVSALLKEMQEASDRNTAVDRSETERKNTRELVAEKVRKHKELLAQVSTLEKEIHNLEDVIRQQIPLPDKVDVEALRQKVEQANITNESVHRLLQRNELAHEIVEASKRSDTLTRQINSYAAERQDAIARAKMPIKGLSFGDGEVLYNGLPFAQASDAEQLRVSVAIAMAANPELRVLRIRDGSLLDENGLKMVAEMADKNDYQVWIESVSMDSKVGVFMEDGAVHEASALDALD